MSARMVALCGAVLFLACCAVTAGGPFDSAPYGDVHLYDTYSARMADGQLPYRDFFDEYPPLAQPLFLAVRALPGSYQTGFRWTMAVSGAAALALLVLAMGVAGLPRRRLFIAAAAGGVAPLVVGRIFLNAFDLWPALLVSATLLALVLRRERLTYVLLALAVAAKVYPIVLLPLALVESGRDRARNALLWFAGVLVLVHVPFAILGPGGLRFSYWQQIKRGLEVESLGGGLLLALHHVHLASKPPGSTDVAGSAGDIVAPLSSLVALAAVLLVSW